MKSSGCVIAACLTSSPKPSRAGTNRRSIAAMPRLNRFHRHASMPSRAMDQLIDSPLGREARITPRLVDSFYTETMLLADEARAYFDEAGHDARDELNPFV